MPRNIMSSRWVFEFCTGIYARKCENLVMCFTLLNNAIIEDQPKNDVTRLSVIWESSDPALGLMTNSPRTNSQLLLLAWTEACICVWGNQQLNLVSSAESF